MNNTNDIRRAFLDFFAGKGHEIAPSSPLVPQNDPTLMFTNAGMVQFKDIFTGKEQATTPRAVTAQKCVRAGGKHNDLDNVGYTARHHTFFEMLGNFSFGDYFKEEAIPLAWELLTKEFALDREKLFITVYHTDDEAFSLWKKVTGFADEKILRVPTKDNFWAMGDTGPCGPCSEIFYDHGSDIKGKWALDKDGNDLFDERFVEIWNLVFMQFEQHADGKRVSLPQPSIDTGMGLERIAAVLQGKHDNYDIDLFQNLIAAIAEHSPSPARADAPASLSPTGGEGRGEGVVSRRIIADHLRSSCFLMADGVLPSNEGRGYVLRRIMRRAMRHAHLLGCKEPLMYRLVPSLIKEMGAAYPELMRAEPLITENLRAEEERFRQTLERGLKLLGEESDRLNRGDILPGSVAFKLYDTYGFPLDLTESILRDHGITVDKQGFDSCMAEQKARARAAWSGSGDAATQKIWFDIREKTGASEFLGYRQNTSAAKILALVAADKEIKSAAAGMEVWIVTNQTPFYGESGGQCGDSGIIAKDGTVIAEVSDTQKPLPDLHIHRATLKTQLTVGDDVTMEINSERRLRIRANHSATHLLHAALREILGEHVTQKGSYVGDDRLRFDISHGKALSADEIKEIEQRVNHFIWQNSEVSTRIMSPQEAIAAGALALFGEKYGDEVRVLMMGETGSHSYSTELCGGTHVARTGDIGLFKIISESALAAGVRRIEAITGAEAFAYLSQQDARIRELAAGFKVGAEEVLPRVEQLIADKRRLERELAESKRKLAMSGESGGELKKESIGDITFAAKIFADMPPKELRPLAESLLKQLGDKGVVLAASALDGKASLVVAVSKELTDKTDAVELVRTAASIVGGKGGGGKPHMAQAGGPDAQKLDDAISVVRNLLAEQ